MKRFGLLIAGLALCVSMLPAETDYIASGYQYLESGDLERAERMFKAAIKIDLENEQAWEGLKKVHAIQSKSGRVKGTARGQREGSRAGVPAGPDPRPSRAKRRAPRADAQADAPAVEPTSYNLREPNAPSAQTEPEVASTFQPPATEPETAAPVQESEPSAVPDRQVEEINKKLLTKYLSGRSGARDESESAAEEPAPKKPAAKRPAKAAQRRRPAPSEDAQPADADSGSESAASAPPKEPLDDNIDKDLLKNVKKAAEAFDKLRTWATSGWKRESNGATQFIPTYYSPELYKLLVTKLGAQKSWSLAETRKKYRRLMTDNQGVLEFYVKLINTTRKPKAAIPVGDICDRTVLEDDNGNSYKAERFKAPSVTKLLEEDSYTVWFPKYDADGNSVVDKAKEKLFLVINDQEQEPATIRIPFTKKQFEGKAGKRKDDKSWWQKLF